MVIQGLKEVQAKCVFSKKLQGPISSASRNDSQTFYLGDSYALRTFWSQRGSSKTKKLV